MKFALAFILINLSSFSEYRVYQYNVRAMDINPLENSTYTVTSSLNPISYVYYHGGPGLVQVDLVRTWMCKGYTGGGMNICKSPLEKMLDQENKRIGNGL